MQQFGRALKERQTDPRGRRWIYVPYDQLTDRAGPLSREDPRTLGILLVENPAKAARRPYHRQKLALILANMRHFALEQAARGVAVRHVVVNGPYRSAVERLAREVGPLRMMRAAERELRADLAPAVRSGALIEIPHEGWLTTGEQFRASHPKGAPWLMEKFYQHVRRETGILMRDGKPEGGRFNFDVENRKPYRNGPPAPDGLRFTPDAITAEVGELIESKFNRHPGRLDLTSLPATAQDAAALWEWAQRVCLPNFGEFEDAMSERSSGLFHTRISPLLNIGRLTAARVVADALALDIPLAGKEGFVRQILGWREFMRHVHEATDGFRRLPGNEQWPLLGQPGDGGYSRWTGQAWSQAAEDDESLDGGVAASKLGAANPLPPVFWGKESGMRCVDRVVEDVWREGWSHHITRLMVLANLATLLDLSPRELTDWFWVAYIDAFDWVVEPNVLGMGTFALGPLFTTKPYVSGSNYIHKMSDYCGNCRFDPKSDCPFSTLYWAFLERHSDVLAPNLRMRLAYKSLERRPAATRRKDHERFVQIRDTLLAGKAL